MPRAERERDREDGRDREHVREPEAGERRGGSDQCQDDRAAAPEPAAERVGQERADEDAEAARAGEQSEPLRARTENLVATTGSSVK